MNNHLNIIKKISDIKLNACINEVIGGRNQLLSYKRVVWGAGVSGKSFIHTYSDLDFSYVVDSRTELQNQTFMGLSIVDPEILMSEDTKNTVIFLPTVIHNKISYKLRASGFQNIIVPNQLNTSGVGLSINRTDVDVFFHWLNNNKIQYVFLKRVPESFESVKDIDILIDISEIEKLLNCPVVSTIPNKDVIYVDICFSSPIGINSELPLYPKPIADMFLEDESVTYVRGIRVLNDINLLHSYIMHALVHKGAEEALVKYEDVLKDLQQKTGCQFEMTLSGLWEYLLKTSFFPKLDFIRKWAAYNNSEFLTQKTKYSSNSNNSLAVFVFREYLRDKPKLFSGVKDLVLSGGFEELSCEILDSETKRLVHEHVRGGVWEDSYQSKIAGGPFAIGIYKTNGFEVRPLKERIRNYVNERCGVEVNSVHSSDDEFESSEYIKILTFAKKGFS